MPSSVAGKRQIIRACKTKGWSIQPEALAGLERVLQRDEHASLAFVLETWVEPHMSSSKVVTNDLWKRIMLGMEGSNNNDTTASSDEDGGPERSTAVRSNPKSMQPQQRRRQTVPRPPMDLNKDWGDLQVISAFEQPKLVYNTMRQQFRVDEKEWSLFGTAEEKVEMLAQRYALIQQRVLRHDMFRPKSLSHLYGHNDRDDKQLQLTPMERLLGQRHSPYGSKAIMVLGVLRHMDERYYLEDLTGLVPITLHCANLAGDFMLNEDSIYLVEGEWHDGTLMVSQIGTPVLERRKVSLSAIYQQVQHPLFSLPLEQRLQRYAPQRQANNKNPIVVLSDLHLDQPHVVQHLEGVFAQYESQRDIVPLFVLMGNFSSTHCTRSDLQSLLQSELGKAIKKCPYLSEEAHFCLVPGPNDVLPSAVLPWALPKMTFSNVSNMHVSTNPTRLYWQGKEMVVYRTLPQQMLEYENAIILPSTRKSAEDNMDLDEEGEEEEDDDDPTMDCAMRLINTMMRQAHLVPGSDISPIYWNYDHSLRLYPLPSTLVLGLECSDLALGQTIEDSQVIVPGSFSHEGGYAVYRPNMKAPERMDEDDATHEIESPVEFVRMIQSDE